MEESSFFLGGEMRFECVGGVLGGVLLGGGGGVFFFFWGGGVLSLFQVFFFLRGGGEQKELENAEDLRETYEQDLSKTPFFVREMRHLTKLNNPFENGM